MTRERIDTDRFASSGEMMRELGKTLPEPEIDSLAREVLTRLSRHHVSVPDADVLPTQKELEKLAHALLVPDSEEALEIIQDLYDQGESVEHLYLWYLGGAARILGHWWVTDAASFLQVTTAVGRIYTILGVIREAAPEYRIQHLQGLLFASVPNEQHVLGVRMAADMFREHGWDVTVVMGADHDGIISAIDSNDTSVVGLSGTRIESLGDLARLIVGIRVAHPSVRVFVSGRIVTIAREQTRLLAPDWMAADVPEALEMLDIFRERGAPRREV